mgnify:CR=1 FL=1
MSYYLRQGNIVNVATDAIVNAANTELTRTPGICEAIFSAADTGTGLPKNWALCNRAFCRDTFFWTASPVYYSCGRDKLVWRDGARTHAS